MAQSKKQLLKNIQRQCQQAGRALALAAYQRDNMALLDAYGQLRIDIRETVKHLRRAPTGALEQMTLPVTSADVKYLHQRLKRLQRTLIVPDASL
ncbi:hypothetical protein [Ktedonospora formicarum]|uniref:Uncharacterized protein n=1 Tax=Ktedonospora formicarum TaxID=2778364 RepID=A0A8J3I794_9CHLR|nr:hypothetical protein [Ktedonospora formicarum]GHO50849.1 hypothetical protein KSX_90120 [Ktedonospora formicarum]